MNERYKFDAIQVSYLSDASLSIENPPRLQYIKVTHSVWRAEAEANTTKNSKMNATIVTTVQSLMESATTESTSIVLNHMSRFTWLDYFFFVVLVGFSTFIGFYYGFVSKHKQNNTSEYILGGQTMKILPIATSLVTS